MMWRVDLCAELMNKMNTECPSYNLNVGCHFESLDYTLTCSGSIIRRTPLCPMLQEMKELLFNSLRCRNEISISFFRQAVVTKLNTTSKINHCCNKNLRKYNSYTIPVQIQELIVSLHSGHPCLFSMDHLTMEHQMIEHRDETEMTGLVTINRSTRTLQ